MIAAGGARARERACCSVVKSGGGFAEVATVEPPTSSSARIVERMLLPRAIIGPTYLQELPWIALFFGPIAVGTSCFGAGF